MRVVRVVWVLSLSLLFGMTGAKGDEFEDLLDYHAAPTQPSDRHFNIFFDRGAWHGYSLLPQGSGETGFTGPFIHSLADGVWAGAYLGRLDLTDADTGRRIDLAAAEGRSFAAPGYLQIVKALDGLSVEETLFFADSWHAVIRVDLRASRERHLLVGVSGRVVPSGGSEMKQDDGTILQSFPGTGTVLSTRLAGDGVAAQASLSGADFRLAFAGPLNVLPGQAVTFHLEQTLLYDSAKEAPPSVDYAGAWSANRRRWAGYLDAAAHAHLDGVPDPASRHVAAKAIVTLMGNWRAARGDLHHDGVVPSYSNPDFNGFWAWDSWKHVYALARVDPDLARSQMSAMYDYQAEDGMIPDCIFLDSRQNNWRNSKPPLAAWAALELFRATGDRPFLASIHDRLVRYHRWWQSARDHDRDGLAEYGATDGTVKAARWESGMDDAARFDDIVMVRNDERNWSASQESVDLNAYLYAEKIDLAAIAEILGLSDERQAWLREADLLKAALRQKMFDEKAGYFFDVRLDGTPVRTFGPEGWIPLWASAASPEQAQAVAGVMLAPDKFATLMPFPTLAADDPRFDPAGGYWRGTVWLDQAYFAVVGLHKYGFATQAAEMARRLVLNADGLSGQKPIFEVYDPRTGQGGHTANFSWSAAHYLMLLTRGD